MPDTGFDRAPPVTSSSKFRNCRLTAKGEPRAFVSLRRLTTLWFNTDSLCNIACNNCYIESSPRNDRLAYLTAAEVCEYIREIQDNAWPVEQIGFTGGEPFLNREFVPMLRDALSRGFKGLVLGSVSEHAVKTAPCPVVVVRGEDDPAAASPEV